MRISLCLSFSVGHLLADKSGHSPCESGAGSGCSNLKKAYRREIEDITLEIATLEKVPPELREEVIGEFYHLALAQQYISREA